MKKKKVQGSPKFFTFENLKTAIIGDIKLWSSRHHRHGYRRYRRHCCSRFNVEKKDERCKMQMLVMVSKK
jgi:hypothetical protein